MSETVQPPRLVIVDPTGSPILDNRNRQSVLPVTDGGVRDILNKILLALEDLKMEDK